MVIAALVLAFSGGKMLYSLPVHGRWQGIAMQLNLFGGFDLLADNVTALRIPQKRGQALLAYLAVKDGHCENREVIVDLLWPDRFRKQAQASLRQVLFELRKPATAQPLVAATRTEVSLGPGITGCDVWTFDECAVADGLEDAGRALKLYRGPFLDGPPLGPEPFRQWAAIGRARLEGKLDRAVLAATADWRENCQEEQALLLLEELVRLNPMCVPAMMRMMEIEADRGNAAEGLRKYRRYVRRLKVELDEDPPVELEDACRILKSAPANRIRLSPTQRRPAQAQHDPWRKTTIDAPVVAVLPFRYLGNDINGAAMAAAIGEDITMMLSGCRWFSVLSRAATHSFANADPFVPKDFVNRTGADYLVYAAVVESGNGWSVTVELADAESGLITWGKRYDATCDGLMRSPQELCPMIAAALDPAIAKSEQNAISRPALAATGSVAAYRHLVLGYRHYYSGEWEAALACFRDAASEDATYAHAYAMMAMTDYIMKLKQNEDVRYSMQAVDKLARRALEIDPTEAKALLVIGKALAWLGRHDEALVYLEEAADRNPSFSRASSGLAYHAVMIGEFGKAKEYMRTALRLRVGDNSLDSCLPADVLADLHLGDGENAVATAHWAARIATRTNGNFWLTRQVLAAALWAAGEEEAAGKAVVALRRDYDGLGGEEFAAWFPYRGHEIESPVAETFRHFGWH